MTIDNFSVVEHMDIDEFTSVLDDAEQSADSELWENETDDSSHDTPEVDTASGYIPQKAHKIGGAKEPSDKDILRSYETRILRELRSSRLNLARVGVLLCDAKKSLGRGSTLSTKQETTFTKWYQETLGISENQARMWMRWVRPVLDIVDWDDDDDPILNEFASVGPCLFDEVMRLPEEHWFVDEKGAVYVLASATGTSDIPAKELTVRSVKDMRAKLSGKALADDEEDPASHDVRGNCGNGDDGHPRETVTTSDSSEMASDESGAAPPVETDSGTHDSTEDDIEGNGSSGNNAVSETPATVKSKAAKPGLAETLNAEDWQYSTFEMQKLPVLHGKLRADDSDSAPIIVAVNTRITVEGEEILREPVDPTEDAFYATQVDGKTTLFWFDHRVMIWHHADELRPSEMPNPSESFDGDNLWCEDDSYSDNLEIAGI